MYIALVLIVVVIAVGAYALLRNPSSSSQKNTSPTGYPIAVIDTTMGTIKVELYTDKMPITTANFIKLANNGFYSGLVFHRVMNNFMIQGGGFYSNGTQKQDPYGAIKLETSPDVLHVDGAISMARLSTPVDSATSQFFICDGAQTSLDGQYAAFGKVTEGMDVVRAIAAVPTTTKYTSYENWPVDDVIINSITIEST
jgi:peptidyl-prolyl cis-trans isomerase B (cyclophilin B)